MNLPDIIIQFVTVFLGAFLAFWLENVRERRQLRSWLSKYLRAGYSDLAKSQHKVEEGLLSLRAYVATFGRLSEPDTTPTEEDWKTLSAQIAAEFGRNNFLFESESLNVLAPELVGRLKDMQTVTDDVQRWFEKFEALHSAYILPLVVERPDKLTASQRRALALTKKALNNWLESLESANAKIPEVMRVLERHGYAR